MLETMKRGESRRATMPASAPEPDAPVQECVVDWEIGEEVPFVEVGGPVKEMNATPGLLLKHPPQPAKPPHAGVEKALGGTGVKVVNLTATRPMTVAFEPWPETPAPLSVAPEIIAIHQPEHAVSKEYALLLDKMLEGLKTDPRVLLLTGLKARVGVSTVLLNLAGSAAFKKQRVVVVDANGARAGLAPRLGRAVAEGLQEVIGGALALEQAIVSTAVPNLYLLAAGMSAPKKRPLTGEAMSWIVAWLRERFDVILIDGPCIEQPADVAVQAPHADGVFLVLPQGVEASAHKGIAHTISRMGGRLSGLIHTHFEA
jgi:Mrp family chromosome partitioning ATPase